MSNKEEIFSEDMHDEIVAAVDDYFRTHRTEMVNHLVQYMQGHKHSLEKIRAEIKEKPEVLIRAVVDEYIEHMDQSRFFKEVVMKALLKTYRTI